MVVTKKDLQDAAINEDFATFKRLFEESIDSVRKDVDENGINLFHCAAANKSHGSEIIKYLLSKEININQRGRFGETPLMVAARFGTLNNLEVLLESGADFNIQDKKNYTVLHSAVKNESHGVEIIKYLASIQGLDINRRDRSGFTALYFAIAFGTAQSVQALLEVGADFFEATVNKSTPFYQACKDGKPEMVQAFLDFMQNNPNQQYCDLLKSSCDRLKKKRRAGDVETVGKITNAISAISNSLNSEIVNGASLDFIEASSFAAIAASLDRHQADKKAKSVYLDVDDASIHSESELNSSQLGTKLEHDFWQEDDDIETKLIQDEGKPKTSVKKATGLEKVKTDTKSKTSDV